MSRSSEHKITKKNGGVFLVVVDESKEFGAGVDHASYFANAQNGYVALLNIIEHMQFQNWQGIEDKVKKETRDQAERQVWEAAGRVRENTGSTPMVCIEEGDRIEVIVKTIKDNPNIVALVLGALPNTSKPGPLVSYFSGKGLSRLTVPLIIVPDSLRQ